MHAAGSLDGVRIDLRSIPDAGEEYRFHIRTEDWKTDEAEDGILGLNEPLQVHIEVQRAGNEYIISGRLRGSVLARCDRCLGAFVREMDSGFRTFLALPKEGDAEEERELEDEDLEVDLLDGGELEVLDLIREQILLDQPMKRLCRDDCKGLCPRCGKDLNQGPCLCTAEQGHPAFQKLNALKKKGEQD